MLNACLSLTVCPVCAGKSEHHLHPQSSSSYSGEEEDSPPLSPKSPPSPKVSPGLPKSSGSSSSGASSHGSSQEDLDDLKDTDRELLEEIIVKDMPEPPSDPVRQFEDSHPTIHSIPEDPEQPASTECKDLVDNDKGNFSKSSFDPLSSSNNSSDPILEMPSKDDDETSPTSGGLAAPDSKDSLEVQLTSVCDDISENLSGKEESIEDLKNRAEESTSQSEEEKNSVVDDVKGKQEELVEKIDIVEITDDNQEDEQSKIVEKVAVVTESEPVKLLAESSDSRDSSFEIVEAGEEEEENKVDDSVQKIVTEVKKESIEEVSFEQVDAAFASTKAAPVAAPVTSNMNEVMEIFEKIETEQVSADPKENIYQTTVKKLEEHVSIVDECIAVTVYKTGTTTTASLSRASSSSFEEAVPSGKTAMVSQDSTESSSYSAKLEVSNTVSSDSSISKLDTTIVKADEVDDTIEEDDTSDASEEAAPAKKDSSSDDSSDTEEEGKVAAMESSSDYDTSSAKKQSQQKRGKRPDSFVSDTSSDYDSLSNLGEARRSFVLEDEYDVITEEETAEMTSRRELPGADDATDNSSEEEEGEPAKETVAAKKDTSEDDGMAADGSSSESEGPDEKKANGVGPLPIPPSGVEGGVDSSDLDGISSFPPTNLSSVTSTVDLHADNVSVDVAHSSVIHSNTLEEIDPLAQDGSAGHPSPLTRSSDSSNTESKDCSQGIGKYIRKMHVLPILKSVQSTV